MNEDKILAYKKRKLLRTIIAEFVIIVGAVLYYSQYTSLIFKSMGFLMSMIGVFVYLFAEPILRSNKAYGELAEEADQDDDASFENIKEMSKMVGVTLIVVVVIFSIAMLICGIFLIYQVTHSWIKTFLILWTMQFVGDLREYFNIARN